MVQVMEFEVSDKVLREMQAQGKSILSTARVFENTFAAIVTRLRKGTQVEDYLTAELNAGIPPHCKRTTKPTTTEAGKVLADEVKRWQAAKVRVPYRDGLFPFLDCTAAITARINEVHGWFD
jgi:hypothetical protein